MVVAKELFERGVAVPTPATSLGRKVQGGHEDREGDTKGPWRV